MYSVSQVVQDFSHEDFGKRSLDFGLEPLMLQKRLAAEILSKKIHKSGRFPFVK